MLEATASMNCPKVSVMLRGGNAPGDVHGGKNHNQEVAMNRNVALSSLLPWALLMAGCQDPAPTAPAAEVSALSFSATSEWQVVPAVGEWTAYNPCLAEDMQMNYTLNWRFHWVTTPQGVRQVLFDHVDDSWDVRLVGLTTGQLWLPTPGNRDMQMSTASGDFLVWTQRFVYQNQTTGAVLDWPLRITFVTNASGEVKVYRVEDQYCKLRG
jgi:hypothetical protein